MKPEKRGGAKENPEDLERKASAVLELSDDDLREQFISIAASTTPTQAYEKAFDLAVKHFDARTATGFAKSCRYLAIIRRDYGQAEFEKSTQ
jgi:hypothetical protein